MRYKFMPLILIALLLLPIGCGQQDSSSHNYVGSVNSDKYHVPSCRWAQNIKSENEVWFSSSEEARAAGYSPCKTCKP
jgi:methylphosphotriester-DNA--protein-cysteine methyltransferase